MNTNNGWKLVPVEPTSEMWAAVNKLDDQMAAGGYDGKGASIEQVWNCLVETAPEAPPLTVTVDPDPRGVSVGVYQGSSCVYHGAHEVPAPAAGDAIRDLIGKHAELLEQNDYAYFELARTRQTGWMAWLCSHGEDQIAVIYNCTVITVRDTLALLDCPQVVQNAVEAGQITLTHVKALAKLTPDEQRAKVSELVAAGQGAKPHERSRKQAAILGERPRVKSRKQIQAALETSHGDYAAALNWVLGMECV